MKYGGGIVTCIFAFSVFTKALPKDEKCSLLKEWICLMYYWCTVILICVATVKLFNIRFGEGAVLSEVGMFKCLDCNV